MRRKYGVDGNFSESISNTYVYDVCINLLRRKIRNVIGICDCAFRIQNNGYLEQIHVKSKEAGAIS